MSSALLASAQKDLVGQSRDLTQLVRKVKDILPQHTDDHICEALIQCDEDIDRSVELLLNTPFQAKAGKKKKERKDRQAATHDEANNHGDAYAAEEARAGDEGWGDWGDDTVGGGKELQPEVANTVEVPQDDRPKTEAEKHASKLRKKLREIERIEERLRKQEKVDPLQLPKIEKKAEVADELALAERKVREEEAAREEERRIQEEELRRIQEEERRRREEEERQERLRMEEQRRAEAARHEEERRREAAEQEAARRQRLSQSFAFKAPPSQPPQAYSQRQSQPAGKQSGQPQAMGAQLLSMLHKDTGEAQTNYQQSRQIADQMSGGRSSVIKGQGGKGGSKGRGGGGGGNSSAGAAAPEREPGGPGYALRSRRMFQKDWAHEEDDDDGPTPEQDSELTNQYSTPLDKTRFTAEQVAEAERIANEIEKDVGSGPPREQYRRGTDEGHRRGNEDYRRSGDKGGERGSGGKGKGRGRSSKGEYKGDGEKGGEARGKGRGRGKDSRESHTSEPRHGDRSPQQGAADKTRGAAPASRPQTRMESHRLNW